MAEPPPGQGVDFADLQQIARAIASEIWSVENLERQARSNENVLTKSASIWYGTMLGLIATAAAEFAKIIVNSEEIADPAFRRLSAIALKDITGIDTSDLGGAGGRGGREGVARNIGAAMLRAMTGGASGAVGAGGQLQPSTRPAEDFLTFTSQLALEGWLTGLIGEICSVGQIESLGDLDDALVNALGINQAARSATGPLLDTLVRLPAEWQVNKTYRPQLLTAASAVRKFTRGLWTREQLYEELARQGWSDDRIEVLVAEAEKTASVGQILNAVRWEQLDRGTARQLLREQGYPVEFAEWQLDYDANERIFDFQMRLSTIAADAYAARRIDAGDFDRLLGASMPHSTERARIRELAELRRTVNTRQLSESDVKEAVSRGILSTVDYRRWLENEGYDADSVATKELLLRSALNDKREADEARERLAEERRLEKERKAREADERKARLEAERAVTEPSLGQAIRFFVRGVWSEGDLAAFLSAERYDGATIAATIADAAIDRENYLEAERRRELAREREGRRDLNLAQLERAALRGILSAGDYRQRVAAAGYTAADVELLARDLEERITERRELEERRRQLEAAAATKEITLSQAQAAVFRGLATPAQLDEWLASRGYTPFDRSVILALVNAELADLAEAARQREQRETDAAARQVPLAETRRAVIRGLRPRDDYARALTEARISGIEAQLQLDLLDDELADQAAAAEQRRLVDAARADKRLTLAQLERAVLADYLTPDEYAAALAADGWDKEEIALLRNSLLATLQAQRQARARTSLRERLSPIGELTLAQLAELVRAGIRPIGDYTATATARGYAAEDVADLTALLEAEAAAAADARRRRDDGPPDAPARALSLAQLAAAVRAGLRSLEDYRDAAIAAGYPALEAELLAQLLAGELDAATAAAERRAAIEAADGPRALDRGRIETLVLDGVQTLDDYGRWLSGAGYDDYDRLSLLAWLADRLEAKAAAGSPAPEA